MSLKCIPKSVISNAINGVQKFQVMKKLWPFYRSLVCQTNDDRTSTLLYRSWEMDNQTFKRHQIWNYFTDSTEFNFRSTEVFDFDDRSLQKQIWTLQFKFQQSRLISNGFITFSTGRFDKISINTTLKVVGNIWKYYNLFLI